MSYPSSQFASFRGMEMYEPFRLMNTWGDRDITELKGDMDISPNGDSSAVIQVDVMPDNKSEYPSPEPEPEPELLSRSDQENGRPKNNKILRRLAQNREAARKSRLRKKVYVQQLEKSRIKLSRLEQELAGGKQQGVNSGSAGPSSTGVSAFEMVYGNWVVDQRRHIIELRNALQVHVSDIELRMLVESSLNHYSNLFRMKADAARSDIFYLMSGMWRTPTERFFHWIGGFRPSELMNVVMPHIEPLTDLQFQEIHNLQLSSQQAEDALSQGIDRLQQTLAEGLIVASGSYPSYMVAAIDKLEALEDFLSHADHLRQQTLELTSKILTTHQTARGLLALGEYFNRLRALNSLWAARP